MIASNASIHAALIAKRTLRRLDPAGEKQNQPFQLSFNPSLKVDFQGSRVTSNSGLLLVRELDERLGLSALILENILDAGGEKHAGAAPRSAATVHLESLGGIRRSERCGAAVARSDLPLDRFREDLGSRGRVARPCETEVLTQDENLEGLSRINRELLAKAEAMDSPSAGGAGYGQHRNPGLRRTGAECLQRPF